VNRAYIIDQLERNLQSFQILTNSLTEVEYLFKKDPMDWCLLEIICHLYDEEREDFRMRLQTVLEAPFKHPPAINPEEWVLSRNYIDQDFEERRKEFIAERKSSVIYLRGLKSPNWSNYYEHPTLGNLDGDHFLRNWLAHDYLHLRQITQRKYQYLQEMTGNECNYAGTW